MLSEKAILEAKKYEMTFDYHTHTTFSHGTGSIEDNVKEAIAKGLKAIAISDHGPGHLTYGVKRADLPVMRSEIDVLKKKYPQIDILLSVEANIVSNKPYTDVIEADLESLDFLIAGYHYGITKGYCISNWLDSHLSYPKTSAKKLLVSNTEMTVACIYENDLKILTHPGDKGRFDIDEIARACSERGTWLEINMKHPFLDMHGIKIASKYDVEFVISSDAHVAKNVGTFARALARSIDAGLDPDRIVNIKRRER